MLVASLTAMSVQTSTVVREYCTIANTSNTAPKYCRFNLIQHNPDINEQVIKLREARGKKNTQNK